MVDRVDDEHQPAIGRQLGGDVKEVLVELLTHGPSVVAHHLAHAGGEGGVVTQRGLELETHGPGVHRQCRLDLESAEQGPQPGEHARPAAHRRAETVSEAGR